MDEVNEDARRALLDELDVVEAADYRAVVASNRWLRDRAERAERERDEWRGLVRELMDDPNEKGCPPVPDGWIHRPHEPASDNTYCERCGEAWPCPNERARVALSADADADAEPEGITWPPIGEVPLPPNAEPSCGCDPAIPDGHELGCTQRPANAEPSRAEGGEPEWPDCSTCNDTGAFWVGGSRAIGAAIRALVDRREFGGRHHLGGVERAMLHADAAYAVDAALASGGVVDVMEHKKALEAQAATTDEWKVRARELEAVLRAIAVHDWEALHRIGGDVWQGGDLYSTPADFDLEGDFEVDARHIFPARHRAILQAARAALEGGRS